MIAGPLAGHADITTLTRMRAVCHGWRQALADTIVRLGPSSPPPHTLLRRLREPGVRHVILRPGSAGPPAAAARAPVPVLSTLAGPRGALPDALHVDLSALDADSMAVAVRLVARHLWRPQCRVTDLVVDTGEHTPLSPDDLLALVLGLTRFRVTAPPYDRVTLRCRLLDPHARATPRVRCLTCADAVGILVAWAHGPHGPTTLALVTGDHATAVDVARGWSTALVKRSLDPPERLADIRLIQQGAPDAGRAASQAGAAVSVSGTGHTSPPSMPGWVGGHRTIRPLPVSPR